MKNKLIIMNVFSFSLVISLSFFLFNKSNHDVLGVVDLAKIIEDQINNPIHLRLNEEQKESVAIHMNSVLERLVIQVRENEGVILLAKRATVTQDLPDYTSAFNDVIDDELKSYANEMFNE